MKVIGYMCKTDFEHELQESYSGAYVYSDIEDLIESKPCVEHCGIVKVEVNLVEVIKDSDYFGAEYD